MTAASLSVPEQLRAHARELEIRLHRFFDARPDWPTTLRAAIEHAVLGGGKRLRPALVLEAALAVGGEPEHAWPGAIAIELVHGYSLVHDDLPCMDDDELRRGKPTVHKAFGEATAVLAGDALLTLAFEVLAEGPAPARLGLEATRILASAAGAAGMVAGQVLDLEAEGESPELERVRQIHAKKTGALLTAALALGACLGGADEEQRGCLLRYGEALGLAFQIVDDCLDETATAEELGKTAGKDREAGKLTWPACIGIEASLEEARSLANKALSEWNLLRRVDLSGPFLHDLPRFVVERGS